MQRITAAAIITLASCLIAANERKASQRPPTRFSIELRVTDSPLLKVGESFVTITIGNGNPDSFAAAPNESNLGHCFESLREAALDALFKKLRMA